MMETNGDARNAEVEKLEGGKRESHQMRATLSPESKKAPVNHDVMSQKENRSSEDGNEYYIRKLFDQVPDKYATMLRSIHG